MAGLPTRFPHLPALDGLRAVAVLTVLAYHFGADWLPGGFLGVDTFFVLSGYLITSLLLVEWGRRDGIHLTAFWIRRARRLLPALLLLLVVVVIWAAIVWPADRLGGVRSDSMWSLFYGANWHFIFSEQSYFDLVSNASPLRHLWSLAIEEQFYLLWPLLVIGALRLGKGRTHWLAGLCVAGAAASIAVMAALYQSGDPSRAYYGTDSRAHGLLLGALLAVILAHRSRATIRPRWLPAAKDPRWGAVQVVGLVGVAVMAVMFATATDSSPWLYPWGFVLFEMAVLAVILAISTGRNAPLSRVLSWSLLGWIGAISYGLYLWHWPVLVFLNEGNTGLDGFSLFAVRTGVTLGATVASYYLLEQPIRHGRWLHGWVGWAAAPAGVALTAAVILGGTRNATPPPDYLVANPDQVLTIDSDPMEDIPPAPTTATTVPPVAGAPVSLPPREVGRVLLIGDSVAASAAPAFSTYARDNGLSFTSATRPGCGIIVGKPAAGPGGPPLPWADACDTTAASFADGLAAAKRASTVVWMSAWESADRWIGDTLYEFGTPEGDELVLRLIDEQRARLLAGTDSLLVLVKQPPNAAMSDFGPADEDNVQRMVHLNALLDRYAAEHPIDTRVMDLSETVCPGGPPCPQTVDGLVPRPRDGGHFSEDGGAWLAPLFYEQLYAVAS